MIEAPHYATVPPGLEASEPPEARGLTRDDVRLLVGRRATGEISHHRFRDLPGLLREGDVLVVNTSATLPAAVPVRGRDLTVHFSSAWSDGRWLVELRRPLGDATVPYSAAVAGESYRLPGGASIRLEEPYSMGRLWEVDVFVEGGMVEYLGRYGRPIRYGYVHASWRVGVLPDRVRPPSRQRRDAQRGPALHSTSS